MSSDNKPHHETNESIDNLSDPSIFNIDEDEDNKNPIDEFDGNLPTFEIGDDSPISDWDVDSNLKKRAHDDDELISTLSSSVEEEEIPFFTEEEEMEIRNLGNSTASPTSTAFAEVEEGALPREKNDEGNSSSATNTGKNYKKIALIAVGCIITLTLVMITTIVGLSSENENVIEKSQESNTVENKTDESAGELLDVSSATIQLSSESIFNPIQSEPESIKIEEIYANSDPTTVKFIKDLEEQIISSERLNNDLNFKLDKLTSDNEMLNKEILTQQNLLEKLEADLKSEKVAKSTLESELSDVKNKYIALNAENEVLKSDSKEKEQESANKDKEIERLTNIEVKLTKIINELEKFSNPKPVAKKNEPKQQKPISPVILTMVSVDPQSGSGKFIVIENGKAKQQKEIKPGMSLEGRGTVTHIDAWGCIYFESATQYEPLGGYCK
ncbi:hypothetical protein [Vibrio cholerae]|uniref:Uncharacterized protein n=1 Tax=Vibrio cholerae TaxID=666 RepID=A0ABD7SS52_VIBCL|nr:hypothetical protein [Vibrio cholerae]TXX67378.1 hypothetical protein FXF03_02025 [Vibrio cholerae]GIB00300.1 hypothetical protein VCSRO136_2565 [Vibrio cholerae]HDI3137206.1 hypothetical protein [Vibrio cholerae]